MSNSFVFINDNNELHKLNMNVTSNQNDLTFDNNLIINGNVEPTRLNIQAKNDNIGGVLQLNKGLTADANNTHDFEILNHRPNDNNRHLIIRGKEQDGGIGLKDFMKIGYFYNSTNNFPRVELGSNVKLALNNNSLRFGNASNGNRYIICDSNSLSNGIQIVGTGDSNNAILKIRNKSGLDNIIECYSDKVKINKDLYVDGGGLAVTSTGSDDKITIIRTDAAIGGSIDIGMTYDGGGSRGATGYMQVKNDGTNNSAPNFSLYLENDETVSVLSNGNVGIGTTTPNYDLDVTGDINFTGEITKDGSPLVSSLWTEDGNNIYYDSGEVGIGTNDPTCMLDVRGNMRLGNETIGEQDIRFYSTHGDWQVGSNLSGNGTSNNQFYISDTNYRLTIQHGTGNVGIGTNNPSYKLDVNGNINFTGTLYQNGSTFGGSAWAISNNQTGHSVLKYNGNVQIGSYSQYSYKLWVEGSSYFNGDVYNNGSVIAMWGKYQNNAYYTNGNVGIGSGAHNADANLHVIGSHSSDPEEGRYVYWNSTHSNVQEGVWDYGSSVIAIKFKGFLWGYESSRFIQSSDSRIKTNIVDVPDNLALEQLRNIPCRYYEYIDKINRGTYKTIGFIAQEVKSIIPMAVSQQKAIIPNIYKVINCTWTSNDDTFIMSSSDLSDVSGVKYKFYVSNASDGSDEKEIEIKGNSDNTFTFDTQYINVFCYGSEVEDFHTLDKHTLFTLNFSATQEIDRQQIADKQRITNLETENATLKAIIDKLTSATSFEEFKNSL